MARRSRRARPLGAGDPQLPLANGRSAGVPVLGPAPRLYQQAAVALTEMIGSGRLAPGDRLSETGVAALLDVSRTPARMALRSLAEDGLLANTPRGYVVCKASRRAARSQPEALRTPVQARPSWRSIYRQVEVEIRARIAFGSWRINEVDLARYYGVSRTVARDVLGRLEQCGIVAKNARAHWYAPALTPARVRELYELRALLEPAALAKAAQRVDMSTLCAMLNELDEAAADPVALGGERMESLERSLHLDLLRLCDSQPLFNAVYAPQALLAGYRFFVLWPPNVRNAEPVLAEHRDIVSRLVDADVAGAAAAMRLHLEHSSERASARLTLAARTELSEEISYLQRMA